MGSAAFGGTYAAPIWRQFMAKARRGFCGDFPQPTAPAELSSYSSDQTEGSDGLEGQVEVPPSETSAPTAPAADAPSIGDDSAITSPDAEQVPDAGDVPPGTGGVAN